jgi:glycosyltransferase involved in cell wall biosynthesis
MTKDNTHKPVTLVIQIPCFNEAQILAQTLADLPKEIPGVDRMFVLVIDDGSVDGSENVALAHGADYVLRQRRNRGLASAFMEGIQFALSLGADIIVNTDADNQYPGRYIPELVMPILGKKADIVIGDRKPGTNKNFSPSKRFLEKFGSFVLSKLLRFKVSDGPSGFRAFSRFAALRFQVFNSYSYTLETLILAEYERMQIVHIPIETNPSYRPSRLHQGNFNFIWRQGGVIIRSYVLYRPLKTFVRLAIPLGVTGLFFIFRFLYFYIIGDTGVGRYIQSVSLGGVLVIFSFLLVMLGLLGDAIRANQKTMEEIMIRLRDEKRFDQEESVFLGCEVIKNRQPGDQVID